MKKLFCISLIICSIGGCFTSQLTNILGWDLSACTNDPMVCAELFLDNQSQIIGEDAAINIVLEQL